MKTIANVWLLPTKDTKSILVIDDNSRKLNICEPDEAAWGHQHLYITLPQSDLEISKIKKHGYYIIPEFNTIYQCIDDMEILVIKDVAEKIIATTDTSLTAKFSSDGEMYGKMKAGLSSIPQSFIEHFISEYNKGNKINQVEVEIGNFVRYSYDMGGNIAIYDKKLKLNQQNEIYIAQNDDLPEGITDFDELMYGKERANKYSRKEVESLIYSAMKSRNYTPLQEFND